jgi:hypothetical protein
MLWEKKKNITEIVFNFLNWHFTYLLQPLPQNSPFYGKMYWQHCVTQVLNFAFKEKRNSRPGQKVNSPSWAIPRPAIPMLRPWLKFQAVGRILGPWGLWGENWYRSWRPTPQPHFPALIQTRFSPAPWMCTPEGELFSWLGINCCVSQNLKWRSSQTWTTNHLEI